MFFYGAQEDIFEVSVFEPALKTASIPEALIHAIWQHQQFQSEHLQTVQGESISIIHPGIHNHDAGPDFTNAKIELNGVLWHGDIEIHRRSADWFSHNHHANKHYNSTILHVTLASDNLTGSLYRQDGSAIPELVLSPLLTSTLREMVYTFRTGSRQKLACNSFLDSKLQKSFLPWITHLGRQRLLKKKARIEAAFLQEPSLESILHKLIFAGLGYAKNQEAMLNLATRIPLSIARSMTSRQDLEALHLGIAGLLEPSEATQTLPQISQEYLLALNARFQVLNKTLNITPMSGLVWKFFRLRPPNFPTMRIAQAASLYQSTALLHKDAIGTLNAIFHNYPIPKIGAQIKKLFRSSPASFWETHYNFGKSVSTKSHRLGRTRVHKLVLNAILPVMLVVAEQSENPELERTILAFAETLKPEKDVVTRLYNGLSFKLTNAVVSQGLHELYGSFCTKGKCVSCKIGKSIINNDLNPVS